MAVGVAEVSEVARSPLVAGQRERAGTEVDQDEAGEV